MWWESPDDVVYIPQPNAFTITGLCSALASGQTVVLSNALDPDRIETELVRYGITIIRAVPAIVQPLVARDRPPPPPDHRLRVVRTGTAALPVAAQHDLAARYGVAVVQEYGSTESGVVIGTPQGGAPDGSIGTPYAGVESRIVDEAGMDVPDGAVGELVVRSPGVMPGYYGDPDASARVLRDGWLWTGDLAQRDTAGFLFLEGRRALRINVGGFKVAPEEVEGVLAAHPHVREVAVVAQLDAARGEVVRAIIVPDSAPSTVGELRHYCQERLAGYKVPRQWEFRDALPHSPLGKILRQHLTREQ
jgi:long-chain acyl-CoA synthetase